MKRRSVWIPLAYLLVAGMAIALPFLSGGSGEAGIWAVLLTLPWPMVMVPIIDRIDPTLVDRGYGAIGIGAGAILNAIIIHFVLRTIEREKAERAT